MEARSDLDLLRYDCPFAATILIEPVVALFPERWLELLDEHMRLGGWMMLTVIVAAPILEEILFRGIIQGSLVRKYGPWRGVLVASAIFGVVHGIPQQVVNAFSSEQYWGSSTIAAAR